MTDAATAAKPGKEDKALRAHMANALWKLDNPDGAVGDRKEAFKAVRKDYMLKAGKVIATLRRRGVEISLTDGD